MILNIVCDDANMILERLKAEFETPINGMEVTLFNRVSKRIAEFEIYSDKPACVSIEGLHEALYDVDDWDIRFRVDK